MLGSFLPAILSWLLPVPSEVLAGPRAGGVCPVWGHLAGCLPCPSEDAGQEEAARVCPLSPWLCSSDTGLTVRAQGKYGFDRLVLTL